MLAHTRVVGPPCDASTSLPLPSIAFCSTMLQFWLSYVLYRFSIAISAFTDASVKYFVSASLPIVTALAFPPAEMFPS